LQWKESGGWPKGPLAKDKCQTCCRIRGGREAIIHPVRHSHQSCIPTLKIGNVADRDCKRPKGKGGGKRGSNNWAGGNLKESVHTSRIKGREKKKGDHSRPMKQVGESQASKKKVTSVGRTRQGGVFDYMRRALRIFPGRMVHYSG